MEEALMSPAPIELPSPDASSPARDSGNGTRFSSLRGVRWRIDLGILPFSPFASIEDLRRVAANSRRSYASLRRHLLIDPHLPKDGNRSDIVKDDPLSQNPDSIWGRFFRNAELEKMVDQDLSRLYPEHGSYFQTPASQVMLRRILLLWCLRHPESGYRQGMHELLAPLLYVLHVDLQHLSQVKELYEDCFNDEFDGASFSEKDLISDYRLTKGSTVKVGSLDELDPDTRDIFLLSDAYGAEGELGVILSERFMEHDAYCMFDSLMNGAHGMVAMADFFSPSHTIGSSTAVPPVIEASSALYHLLSIVDSSLHNHLVELGVEPQYFALRWLRVLFGREFSLDDLLVIWDELFSSPNQACIENDAEYGFRILCCPRGAFISAMAVSMLFHVRSSLFATENATSCLQRLLNFPNNINVKKLIEKAKSLQALALDTNISLSSSQGSSNKNKQRIYSLSSGSVSPMTPLYPVPDSYWEEKWRVLHREEQLKKGSRSEERFGLSRAESDPSPSKAVIGEKDARSSVRRRLLDDLSREIDSEKSPAKAMEAEAGKHFSREIDCATEENSLVFSTATSPRSADNDDENDSVKSSVTSDFFIASDDQESNQAEEPCNDDSENPLLQDSESVKLGTGTDGAVKQEAVSKERKPPSGKFQWFWKFGRGSGEGNAEKGGSEGAQRSSTDGNIRKDIGGSTCDSNSHRDIGKAEAGDKKVMGTLKNLGQSMIENIQLIESAFQQDRGPPGNILGGKGQNAAMAALTELRKISNLLSEM